MGNKPVQRHGGSNVEPEVIELIEKYDMTYTQARRYAMYAKGMNMSEIAKVEGVGTPTVQSSISLARDKVAKNRRSE